MFSPPYQDLVLRPLAEQLVAAVELRPGMDVLDVLDEGGVCHRELVRVLGDDAAITRTAKSPFPCENDEFDLAVNVVTLGFISHPGAVFEEMRRVTRRKGRVALLCYDKGSRHESLFWQAWCQAGGDAPAHRQPDLPLTAEVIDVLRFDGTDHFIDVMSGSRIGIAELNARRLVLKAELESRLAPYAVADGTIRLPVSAQLRTANP